MASDGEIAQEEVNKLEEIFNSTDFFCGVDIKEETDKYVQLLRQMGNQFVDAYLRSLSSTEFDEESELKILDVATKIIYADNVVEYSEIKFFKAIRACLNVDDEKILASVPGVEDYWLENDLVSRLSVEDYLSDVNFAEVRYQAV